MGLGSQKILPLSSYQYIQAIISILICTYVIIFRKSRRAQERFLLIHWIFIVAFSLPSLLWYVDAKTDDALISFIISAMIGAILLINPIVTIIYFSTLVASLIVLWLSLPGIELLNAFYVFFIGVIITTFSSWRHRLSTANKLAEESYRNLFSDLTEQVYVLDQNLQVLEINEAAAQFIGEIKNIEQKKIHEIFAADKSIFDDLIAHSNQPKGTTRKRIVLYVNSQKDGGIEPLELNLRASAYFEKQVYILTARSIRGQKEFEQKIIESRENISKVLDNINSFVFNVAVLPDGDSQVLYVSAKVNEVFGISQEDYITLTKSGRINEIIYHKDREEVSMRYQDVITTCSDNRIKYRIIKNGKTRWVEEKIFPKNFKNDNSIHLFGIVTDVTEQIESLDKVQRTGELYKKIFERNMAGVYKTHVDGTILEVNPAFARIMGYNSPEELKKLNVKDIYYNQEGRPDYIEKLRKEGSLNNFITVLRRRDGKKIYVNNNVSISPDEDGNMNIIEGTLIDVTETTETAAALRQSELKYRLVFDEANAGIILVTKISDEYRLIDFNPASKNLFKASDEQLAGTELKLLTDNYQTLHEFLISASESNNKIETELAFKRFDGKQFLAELTLIGISLEHQHVVQLFIKDISERRRSEEALKNSQESFKSIVDNSPNAILVFTKNKLVYTNEAGRVFYHTMLNDQSEKLQEIFSSEQKYVLLDMLNENNTQDDAFTEMIFNKNGETRKYSVNVVKTTYQTEKSDLIMLHDITLQSEYNMQKMRAELAEESNLQLQQEIESHKKTQAELLAKTYWLNALFESSYNLYILSIDEKFRLTSFNENFRKSIEKWFSKQVKPGDSFLDIFMPVPDAREIIESKLNRALQGETLEMISHFNDQQGKEIWVESFLNPVKIGTRKTREISFISHEITDKIIGQRRIRISEANNRAILQALPDILFKVNGMGIFTDYKINSAYQKDEFIAYLEINNPVGKNIMEVFNNLEVAENMVLMATKAMYSGDLIADNMNISGIGGNAELYYEFRFSKLNDDEVIVLARNITDTIEYEAKLEESVREKEILLKEVHHRVKNNLQVINSILNLQSSYVQDERTLEIINESQNRIRSMSYIHESLYQTKDFSSINFSDYIKNLVQNLVHSYQLFTDKISLEFDLQQVKLALDQAIPCGLILNELVSNSLKYAYPASQKGKIIIGVKENEGKLQLSVEDFGVGLPENFDIENSDSLGLSLVFTLVDQLDGQLSLKTHGGTKFYITFEMQEV
ncbi:MAG: PAS domain S-box protein [Crocinitomicaceae bacterium]|nr:PAS domain S-box protein [Crocinitomicaceae bacterium]